MREVDLSACYAYGDWISRGDLESRSATIASRPPESPFCPACILPDQDSAGEAHSALGRYCKASATCETWISGELSRSAMVRLNLRTR